MLRGGSGGKRLKIFNPRDVLTKYHRDIRIGHGRPLALIAATHITPTT
tara:strand:- start:115 stop:258 length:144 start_codon:yes stop_codon:yes gene_type:complete